MKKSISITIVSISLLVILLGACTLPQPLAAPTSTSIMDKGIAGEGVKPTATLIQPEGKTQIPPTATQIPVNTATPPAGQPTQPPPTATQLTGPTPTVPPIGQSTRIQFAAGKTSATVEGELSVGSIASYILQANSGQTMTVDVWSPNGDVYLGVYGVSNNQTLADPMLKTTYWTSVLNATQDYRIDVVAGNGRTSYSIEVSIPAGSGPTPTAGPSPTVSPGQVDPNKAYGKPAMIDRMNRDSLTNWKNEENELPDDKYIEISLQGGNMYITGKLLGFSTWYFSWPEISDFYLEMIADSGTCSGRDAYGLIIRGPEHKAGKSYGYVVAFSCDGYYTVYRLDSADPFTTKELVGWTKSDKIYTGSNTRNVLGIKAVGDQITIYANNFPLTTVTDGRFRAGRYGVYVNASSTYYYTYRPVQIAWWDLSKK